MAGWGSLRIAHSGWQRGRRGLSSKEHDEVAYVRRCMHAIQVWPMVGCSIQCKLRDNVYATVDLPKNWLQG